MAISIGDLDTTIEQLLKQKAPEGSKLKELAEVSFDVPDADWRAGLRELTVNCYLYDVRQNPELRRHEPVVQRSADGNSVFRRAAPVRLDCTYCITAWSTADAESALEEHHLLSEVLLVLLRYPRIPPEVLQGSLAEPGQIAPYPTAVAAADGIKNQPEFWGALDQQLKPSITYTVTLALFLEDEPAELPVVSEVDVTPIHS